MVGVIKSLYHSSTYAALCDEEWEEMRKEAIELSNLIKASEDELVAQLPE